MLNKVVVNDGVEDISTAAFLNCKFLKIYLPLSLKSISDYCFIRDPDVDEVPSKVFSVLCDDVNNIPQGWRFKKIKVKDVKKEKEFK